MTKPMVVPSILLDQRGKTHCSQFLLTKYIVIGKTGRAIGTLIRVQDCLENCVSIEAQPKAKAMVPIEAKAPEGTLWYPQLLV